MSPGHFRREAAMARKDMSIDELVTAKAKTQQRKALMKQASVGFTDEDFRRVDAQVEDYSRRIKIKVAEAERKAREGIMKTAAELNFAV